MTWLWATLVVVQLALAVFGVASVLRRRKEPMAMLAWVFTIITAPFLGAALYAAFGSNRVRGVAARRRRKLAIALERITRYAGQTARRDDVAAIPALPPELAQLEQLGRRLAHLPATGGNEVRTYNEVNAIYASLEQEIRDARDHIHLQYYIWQPDETGLRFRQMLIDKAEQGVECRVLLDAVGCFKLTRRFLKPLADAGVAVAFYMPLKPLSRRRWSPHLRNHRKIAVFDGRVGFIGSQNIGDEYLGRMKKLSPWYDSQLRVRGPATLFLQQVFAEDWLISRREPLDPRYFPIPELPGASVVQILPSGPDQDSSALGQLLFAAVAQATVSIRIATPYFVPDAALRTALIQARYRGVQVQIVLPTRSDAPIVLWAGRSFYDELLAVGIEIYELDAGMLHSKIMTVDDRFCVIGSANMDIRSFRLNFEVTAAVYDSAIAAEQAAVIEKHCASARRVTVRDARSRTVTTELLEGAARLLTPLL